MNISQLITGLVMVILGVVLIILSFFISARIVILIYGLIALVIGVFILFNTREDKIEQIKKRKGGKK